MHNKNNYKEIESIKWMVAGNLEAQRGQDINKGTAGLLQGKSNGYIIVGGGANFPEKSVLDGGVKKHYSDIYVLKNNEGLLEQVNHTTLDYEIGYGSSILADEGVYYVGGSPDEEGAKKIILININSHGNINVEEVGRLPFTFIDGFAVKHDEYIFFGLGKQNHKSSNKVYKLSLKSNEITELAPIIGKSTRNQLVYQLIGNHIYVFSGGDNKAYTDGYKYSIKDDTWTRVSDVDINGEKISLLGASSVKLNEEEILVIGGFNKEIYDNAVKNLGELTGDEFTKFRESYLKTEPQDFNWNSKILIYNSKINKWRSLGEVPFNAPCGEALVLDEDYIFSINGEIKPGVRTSRMYSGKIFYK